MIVGHSSVNRSTKQQWTLPLLTHLSSDINILTLWQTQLHFFTVWWLQFHSVIFRRMGHYWSWEKTTCGVVWVEIKHHSVAYFECIIEFDTLLHWASVEGRAHTWHVNTSLSVNIWCVYEVHMSPALSGSSALLHVKLGDVLKICNGIIFNFYLGLSHVW